MKRNCFVILFLFSISGVLAQAPKQNPAESHCPDRITASARNEKVFFCNSDSVNKIILHSTLKQKGQSVVFPGSVNTYFWTTDGSGTITQHGNGVASYSIHPDDFKTGWIQFRLEFHLDANIGCSRNVFSDTVTAYLMSFKAEAGDEITHCRGVNQPVEVNGMVYNDNNPGFSNLFTWTSSGTGAFANPYVHTTSYSPSAQDIADGSVRLVFSVRKPECKAGDYVADSVVVHFDICNSTPKSYSAEDVLLYPNPATHELTLIGEEGQKREITILSSDGIMVLRQAFSGTSTIEIDFPAGIYQAVIRNGDLIGIRNFVIQK